MSQVKIVIIAAVVAVASGFGLVSYATGAQERAVDAAKPVSVLVVASDVPSGMPFTQAWNEKRIVVGQTLQSLLPATAVADPNQLDGLLAVSKLPAGQMVVRDAFASPTATAPSGPPTFATKLPEGMVAVSFSAEASKAVSDLVQPGDRVNLLVQVPNASVLGLPDSGGPAIVHAFQDLRIIAIGNVEAPASDAADAPKNPGTGLYTVAVSPADSARLLLITSEYSVYLTLVGPQTSASDVPAVSNLDALPSAPVVQPAAAPTAGGKP
jgi:pilus assembly protein CpaB